tara:strand:+ start:642 stop:1517 length:876 start_codon:yes stop_codon:yes gene_type:complete
MNGRGRKDEPFNPFAANASQKSRDRKDRTSRPVTRPKTPEPVKPSNDLAAKQKIAMELMRKRRELEEKKPSTDGAQINRTNPSPQPKPAPTTSIKKPDNREDRLASLRAKSAATAQYAKDAQDAMKVVETPDVVTAPVIETESKKKTATNIPPAEKTVAAAPVEVEVVEVPTSKISSNVFKTIKTEKKKADRRPKRRRPGDKKGGGRQPQSRKLDRRKYLEYKYIARDLLEHDSIGEEHRSNILGQIWAKGERISAADAIEFITQKEEELILPSEVADEFRKIVKRYTTKR